MRVEFFRAGMKAQGDEGGGRILLGDNTDGGGRRERGGTGGQAAVDHVPECCSLEFDRTPLNIRI
jgi:hypothetical protein